MSLGDGFAILSQSQQPCRIRYLGNPAEYATWVDEGLNAVLRNLAEHSHRMTFHLRVHVSYNLMGALQLNPYIYGDAEDAEWVGGEFYT